MNNGPVVTVIPATLHLHRKYNLDQVRRKRVAAYARVSTDKEEQENSFDAQVSYFTKHIQSNPDWEFVEVYTDEGISATSTKNRAGFNRMMADALVGKIDLILTKSVSRFARNTVDSLTAIRKLKEKGVEVYFQKESIYTLDAKGELLVTIMSSLSQEESRSISENVRWGQHHRMQEGKVSMPYRHFLGYEKGSYGKPQIVESEAEVVRQIYTRFLAGHSYREIAEQLTAEGVPTPTGKTEWHMSTVKSILSNEKYSGNAILQKKYTVDFLDKKQKVNLGEIPQYFVEDSHPAIISSTTFDLAQDEIQRRQQSGVQSRSKLFSGQIVCGECGGFYGPKVWHSRNQYRRVVWRCNARYARRGAASCHTPHLSEESIKAASQRAWAALWADKGRHIADCEAKLASLPDISAFDQQIADLTTECSKAALLVTNCIEINAASAQNQAEYLKRYDELAGHYDAAKTRLDAIKRDRLACLVQREKIGRFLNILCQSKSEPGEFDEHLWRETVETMTIRSLEDIAVRFNSGTIVYVGL